MADQESLEDLKIHFWIEKKVACYSFLQTKTKNMIRWKQCLFHSFPPDTLRNLLSFCTFLYRSVKKNSFYCIFPNSCPQLLISSFLHHFCLPLRFSTTDFFLPDWKLSLAYLIS